MPFDYPVAGTPVPATGTTSKETHVSLKPYDVTINGVETTVLLSDEHAKAQGLLKDSPAPTSADEPKKPAAKKATPAKKAPAPANKARKAPNKKS